MKELEILFSRTGNKIEGNTIDLGDWDVSQGYEGTIYFRNPNPHAKAILTGLRNDNPKLQVELPDEIMPLDVAPVTIRIASQIFDSEEDEVNFFNDILDSLNGKVKWVRP